jgi:RNA polymerase sigma factor (sigma-70 family)
MAAKTLDGFLQRLKRAMTADGLAALADRQLVERFLANGDEAAFHAILGRHGPMVYRVCRRVLGAEQDAEDAFQAVFVILVRQAASIRKRASLACWLHGVARQVALRARTSAQRRRDREARGAKPDEAADPDDRSWSEVRAVLDEELVRLPERLRAPLVLCYLEGLTQDEAADQLGRAKSTFRRQLERGRELLGLRLVRRGVAFSTGLAAMMVSDSATAGVSLTVLDSMLRNAVIVTGRECGRVPMGISKLADEVIKTMKITKLITAALLLTGVLFGTVGSLVMIFGDGGKTTEAREVTTLPRVPALSLPKVPDEKPTFDKLYALKEDEVLKRIAPPFADSRNEYVRKSGSFEENSLFAPEDTRMVVQWKDKKATSAFLRVGLKGPNMAPPPWLTIRDLVEYTTGLSAFELEGEKELLSAEASGDFVVREGATVAKVLPRLEGILRTECNLPVKFQVTEGEREVVVVRGKFVSAPRQGREKNEIDIFSKEPVANSGAGGGSGDLARFLRGVEAFTSKRLVGDVEQGPTGTLSWYFHARSPFTEQQRAEDTDPETVFKTVTAQTGLEFKTEKRKVRLVLVEKVEK